MSGRLKISIFLVLCVLMSSCVLASGEIVQDADRVNYDPAESHAITVTNTGTDNTQLNISGNLDSFTVASSDGSFCTDAANIVTCHLGPGDSGTYTLTSSASNAYYTVTTFLPTANNSYTGNAVKILRIIDDEIFHTLIEYGRGRGNYFYDTYGSGLAGSGHSGTGCSYLPNGTLFQLNFLHKINNVKHWFGDLTATAYNATFTCTYPNNTLVRHHLTTALNTSSLGTIVSYKISKIEGSWERMGYVGIDFNDDSYLTGESFTINCTDLTYVLPAAGGSFVVPEDSFTLSIRDKEPFTATASTTDTIGNGTQEVIITYTITNNEAYTVNDVIFEIQAPSYAQFIGTRGELWGVGRDQYRIEKTYLGPGESETVRLVARFDTSTAPSMSSVDLTQGIKTQYITCWELNAYNPTKYAQTLTGIGTGTVNMAISSQIIGLREQVINIYNVSVTINNTVHEIQDTVTNIQLIVDVINSTTEDTNTIVKVINNTASGILNNTEVLLANTVIILNDTQFISDQINCNGTNDSPICTKVALLNQSLTNIYDIALQLNNTANNLNITVIENINTSGINVTVIVDLSDVEVLIDDIKNFLNCDNTTGQSNTSVCYRLENIEGITSILNTTVITLLNTTSYFNTTVFGNLTFQNILDAIDNISVDTSGVLEELQYLKEFNEEIVFLITDSFGLQQAANDQFAGGDLNNAIDTLLQANNKLMQASDLIAAEATPTVPGESIVTTTNGKSWWSTILIVVLIAGVLLYFLGKAPKQKQGRISAGLLRLVLLGISVVLLCSLVSATFYGDIWGPLGTINQFAGDLNYGDYVKNITVRTYYNCTGVRELNVTFPGGFTLTDTDGACSKVGQVARCTFNDFAPFNYGTYSVTGSATIEDHTILEFPTVLSNTTDCSFNQIKFIKIPDQEIFSTLVEYGRGRGNYFYSTRDGNAGSGHTGVGCPYVPNNTKFELNFLHKVFTVSQYYDNPEILATDVSFDCSYPFRTIVRSHLGTNISMDSANINISYYIDEIEGSWERMGYVGMQFDENEQQVGQNLTISCKDISYLMEELDGYITVYVGGFSFDLQVRDPHPFIATASTTSTIGNGTQEVIITYDITNNEIYTIDNVIIEIQAPPYAEFIGTRGELWGTARDQYRIEKMYLAPGESEVVQLVARFDTSGAPAISSVNLTSGIRTKYITCWDINAYNPGETTQLLTDIGTASVNMNVPASIISVRDYIDNIYELVLDINDTTKSIDEIVEIIEEVVIVVNQTTTETNVIVQELNNTINAISGNVTAALSNTDSIITETTIIKDLIDCDGSGDSQICSDLDDMNLTAYNLEETLFDINTTLHNITINVTINLKGQNITVNITPEQVENLSIELGDILDVLNCTNTTTEPWTSVCRRLIRIENHTVIINETVNQIDELITYFDTTVFGNVTLQQIYDAITSTTLDTSDLLTEIRRISEFSEELVFLVTDSFGLQQAAEADARSGDYGSAVDKLKVANTKLVEAKDRLEVLRAQAESDNLAYSVAAQQEAESFSWFAPLVIFICVVIGIYLLAKRPVEK